MANQVIFFDDTNPNAAATIEGMREDFDKYGINCSIGLNVSGVSTFTGAIEDNNEQVGAAGSVLSSTGSGVRWIPAGEGNTASASNVGVNEDSTDADQWVTFVGAKSGNNPIRVDDGLKYNPNSNILSVGGIDIDDNNKIRIGTGNDLKISHTDDLKNQQDSNGDLVLDGDDWCSYIKEDGAGPLIFKTDGGPGTGAYQFYDTGWRPILKLFSGSSARAALYHAGSEKLVTSTTGITVTGTVAATAFSGDGSALTGIENYSVFTGASASSDGSTGLVTKPLTGDQNKFLRADSTWVVPTDTQYSAFGGTSAGLVPASTAGETTKFLKSDGTWDNSQVNADWDATTGLAQILNKPDVLKFKTFKIRISNGSTEDTDFFNIAAETTTDTFEIVKGANVTLTADTTNKKLTIAAANDNTTYSIATSDNGDDIDIDLNNGTSDDTITVTKGDNITLTHEANGNGFTIAASDTTYDAPTTSVPGLVPTLPTGDTTKVLKSDGNWGTDTNTWRGIDTTPVENESTESISSGWAFTHAADEGNSGHVPAAGTGNSGKFLANNGTWQTPSYIANTDTTYTLPASGTESTDFGNGSAIITLTDNAGTPNTDAVTITAGSNIKLTSIAEGGFTISAQDTTASNFTAATNSAAGAAGLVIAPAAGDHVKFLRGDATWSDISASTITLADESGNSADTTCFLVFSKDATGTEKTLHTNSGIGIDAKEKTITSSKFIVTGGTSSGFLKADGSVDSNTYLQSGEAGTTYTFGVEAPSNSATDRENLKITAGGAGSGDQLIGFIAGTGLSIDLNTTNKTITYAGVDFTGATSSAAGTAGLVKTPAAGDQTKFLKGDGTWATPSYTTNTNTTYTLPAGGTDGTNYTDAKGSATIVLTDNAGTPNTDTVTITAGTNIKIDSTGADGFTINAQDTNTTYGTVSTSAAGLAPTLPAAHGGKFLKADGTWEVPAYNTSLVDKIVEGNTSVEVVDSGTNGHIILTTEGAEAVRIDKDGFMGIGIEDPMDILHLHKGGDGVTSVGMILTHSTSGDSSSSDDGIHMYLSGTAASIDNFEGGGVTIRPEGASNGNVTITTTGTTFQSSVTASSFVKTSNSGGFLKADGTEDTNTYLTSQTSHSDVLVDGDFTSNGFMKTDGSGTYSVDTNSYSTTSHTHSYASSSHTHSYQAPLTFSTGITNTSNTVTVDAAVTTTASWTASALTANTIDTVALSSHSLVEYVIYITHSSSIQSQKLTVMDDGSNVFYNSYGIMYTSSLIATVTAVKDGNDFKVKVTPESGINGAMTAKFIKQVI